MTWDGSLECEGEPVFSSDDQVIPLAIASGTPDEEEPIEEPSPTVDKWAEIPIDVGENESLSVTVTVPADLKPGEYYVYVADPAFILIQSETFAVLEG